VAPFLRIIRSMSKLNPGSLHVDCGIRGQNLLLVVTNNTTASLGVAHPCGYPSSRPSRISAELIPYASFYHVALYVPIWHPVRVVQSERAWCRKDVRGGFPPLRNDQRSLT
jgi:hypothetical protein